MVKKRKKRKKSNPLSNLLIIFNLSLLFILVFLLVYYSPEIIRVFSKEKIIEQDKATAALVSTAKNIKEDQKIKVDMTPSTTGGQGHGLYLREKDSTIDKQTNEKGPKITKGVIDPNDVCHGDTQTMTIYVEDEKYEIVSVVAEIKTDKDTIKKELKLKSGTKKKGVWEESWVAKDVHETTYNTRFIATNSKGEKGEIIISWTDVICSSSVYESCSGTDTVCNKGWHGVIIASGCNMVIPYYAPNACVMNYGTAYYLRVDGGTLSVANNSIIQDHIPCN